MNSIRITGRASYGFNLPRGPDLNPLIAMGKDSHFDSDCCTLNLKVSWTWLTSDVGNSHFVWAGNVRSSGSEAVKIQWSQGKSQVTPPAPCRQVTLRPAERLVIL
jgi:hypothetical protein